MKMSSVHKFILFLSVAYYVGFVSFFERIIKGGRSGGDFESAASGNLINQLVGVLLLGLCLFILYRQLSNFIKQSLLESWPLLVLLSLFACSIFWSYEPSVSFRRLIAFTTLIIVAYYLAVTYSPKSLFNLLVNAILLAIAIGLVYEIASGKALAIGLSDRSSALRGIYSDKNGAARVYAYGLIVFIAITDKFTKLDYIKLSVFVLALSLSQSASAIIMGILGIAIITLIRLARGRGNQQSFNRLAVLIIFSIIGIGLLSVVYEYVLDLMGRDANLTDRAIIWQLLAPSLEDEYWLGFGFGAFWASDAVKGFLQVWQFLGNAHSGFIETRLNAGMLGLAALFLLLISFLRKALQLFFNTNTSKISVVFFAVLIVQTVINYAGYVILNHNSFDMFLFSVTYFCATSLTTQLRIKGTATI
ncbi:O-antigen ligase family protein [Flavobacterium sp. W21_SRS_FM6]|uniref:O-antigen ligase family protein n=1 Tax=Flavobacterium sp. W21_SRS_FM6 TaxID=3240268 RepID=UPI003F8F8BF7